MPIQEAISTIFLRCPTDVNMEALEELQLFPQTMEKDTTYLYILLELNK